MPNLEQIAEALIRNQEDFCEGHYIPEAPWCSMLVSGPLCPACQKHADAILTALRDAYAQGKGEGWQPMATAPKDHPVLLACPHKGVVRWAWRDDQYSAKPRPYWTNDAEALFGVRATRDDQPTHWMPLPAPPEEK